MKHTRQQKEASGLMSTMQQGFTLLEAMVAAGVLSVGLLGLAGLSGMSLGKNVDANDMARVTNIAADMAERIQNNRQRVLDYQKPQRPQHVRKASARNAWPGAIVRSGKPWWPIPVSPMPEEL